MTHTMSPMNKAYIAKKAWPSAYYSCPAGKASPSWGCLKTAPLLLLELNEVVSRHTGLREKSETVRFEA